MTTQIATSDPNFYLRSPEMELSASIRAEISTSPTSSIPFARFMQLALYEPGQGYYRRGFSPIGSAQDFVTAPEISPLFAQSLARQLADILSSLPNPTIVEVGAGNGTLAAELLRVLALRAQIHPRYLIVEPDKELIKHQKQIIASIAPDHIDKVQWIAEVNLAPVTGVVIANEIFDAQPVQAWSWREGKLYHREVSWQDDHFVWCLQPQLNIPAALEPLLVYFPDEVRAWYDFEVHPEAKPLLHQMLDYLEQGIMLIIDYGYAQAEYYHPQRSQGHLLSYRQQRVSTDVLAAPGQGDISVHVDFSSLAEIAHAYGAQILGFATQANFLLNCGFLDDVKDMLTTTCARTRLQVQQAVQLLTSPAEMGEMVKVLALGRDYSKPLRGFTCGDARSRL